MGFTFNPFVGNLDIKGKAASGSGEANQTAFTHIVVDGTTITSASTQGSFTINFGANLATSITGSIVTVDGTSTGGGIDSETAQDIVGAMLTSGSSFVTLTYNDTAGTLSLTVDQTGIDHDVLSNFTTTEHFLISAISITSSQITDITETVQDVVGAFLTVGSGLSFNYTDAAGFLQLSTTAILGPGASTIGGLAFFGVNTGNTLSSSNFLLVTTTGLYLNTTGVKIFFLTSTNYFNAITTNALEIGSSELTILRNDASTGSQLTVRQNGTGDATISFEISTTQAYRLYTDNSDADSFKIDDQTNADTFFDFNPATGVLTLGLAGDVEMGDSTTRDWYPNTDGAINFGTTAKSIGNQYTIFHFLRAGTSSGHIARVGGTVTTNTSSTGNVGAGEDDLMSYSVIANTLSTNGMYLKAIASGTVANNANAKRIRIKFGATTIFDSGAAGIPTSAAADWVANILIIRTGSATQKAIVDFRLGTTAFAVDYTTPAETLTGAVTFKLTGEATSNNDIVQEIMVVEYGAYS